MPRTLSEQEFEAVKTKVLASLPAGLSEEEFSRAAGPRLAAAIGEAENSPEPVTGGAVRRAVGGAVEMLNPIEMAKGAYQAVRHPIDTATAIVGQMGDQWKQAGEAGGRAVQAAKSGQYLEMGESASEAIGHATAGTIPVLGPLAADIGEQIGSGDIAGGLGKTAGVLAPFNAPRFVGAAKRLVSPAMREVGAAGLEAGAASRVVDVMAPKIGPNKTRFGGMAQKVAPELAERGDINALSREGLHANIQSKLADAEGLLDAAANERLKVRTFPTQPIIEDLLAKKRRLMAGSVEGSRVVPEVTGGPVRVVPVDQMQQYALKWMKDDLESVPFTRHTFNETTRQGGDLQIVPGSAGAPIYRAIVGEEGRELIHATRGQVAQAVEDVMAGKTEGRLRQLVIGVANDLAKGDAKTQRLMVTSGPAIGEMPTARTLTMTRSQPAEMPTRTGRPLGEDVLPGPQGDRAAVIDQAIQEIKRLGPVARYDALKTIRQAYDIPAKAVYSPAMTADYLKAQGGKLGAADVTGSLRESLAKFDPQTAAANAEYSLYRTANDVLEATAEIERTRPTVGRKIMARGLGAATGASQGGALGAAVGAMIGPSIESALANVSPALKLQTARAMTALASAIRRGDVGMVTSLRYKLKALAAEGSGALGRATSPSESRSSGAPSLETP